MATPRDLIIRSLRLIERIGATESAPDANDEDVCRLALNDMIDGWNADGLMLYGERRDVANLVSGTAAYTVGAGGDVAITRPVEIQGVGIILDPSATHPVELPLGLPLTQDEYQAITLKSATGVPRHWYYDRTYSAAARATLTLWPVPDSSVYDLAVYTRVQLSEIDADDLATDYALPQGYRQALAYNLALAIAPIFGVQVSPETVAIAATSKRNIRLANFRPSELRFPAYFGGGHLFNYRTGR